MAASNADQGLSWPERWFALKCIFLLQAISIGVRWFGFNPVHSWINRRVQDISTVPGSPKDLATQAVQLGALVGVANRRIRILEVSCLPESLTVWWLLRRRGIQADLRLGVRKLDGRLDGHAWVETSNQVVSGNPNLAQDYSALDALSGSR